MDEQCYDFAADCRVRMATDLLSHNWDPAVLVALQLGPLRRRELITSIGGITDKALTQSLSRLTERGLLERTPTSTSRNVEYALSHLGESFVKGPMKALGNWAIQYGDELLSASADN